MEYHNISDGDMISFRDFMTRYYREGEDKDTPQEKLDAFISILHQMIKNRSVQGRLILENAKVIAIVLWMKDTGQGNFSQMPGYGTILEIGVVRERRSSGIGKQIVAYAEEQMADENVLGYYVSAYGPAQRFWIKCGYLDTGKIASNGLPIFIKNSISQ